MARHYLLEPAPRSRGFGIASALFVIVVIAGLGIAISTVTQTQQKTQALDVLSTQVYHAARAGLQYGIRRAITTADCAAAANWSLTPTQWNGRFSIYVQCVPQTVNDGGSKTIYKITATACNATACDPATIATAGAAGYVERQLSAGAEGP
jgi:MSHA biogenesis protein MshP